MPESVLKDFPKLNKFAKDKGIEIREGEGPGFAEIFFKGETESPDSSKNIIEIRESKDFDRGMIAAGEVLHFMGGMDKGEPLNDEFFNLKQQFIKNMSPREIEFANRKFNQAKSEGATGSNFESFDNFIQNVYGDMLIRGGIFPDLMVDPKERKAFKEKRPFTLEQIDILNQMENLIRDKNK